MTTRLLALDCATETVHLALVVGDATTSVSMPGGAHASATLLPAVQSLLAQAGVTLRSLDAIGFGRGPGAFTGLRTACSVVQGLAVGIGRPLLAIDTLAAVAECAFMQGAPASLWTLLDARMGELYVAAWERLGADRAQPSGWTCLRPPMLRRPADLLHATSTDLAGPRAWAGIGLQALPADTAALLPAWPAAVPHGPALASLARAAFAAGTLIDPSQGLPLYVRDKVALTTQERSAAPGR